MRWIPLEEFTAGEAYPYPPGVAVQRRIRAIPLNQHPWRTWLFSVNGIETWHRLYDRRAHSVVGHAQITRTALRRRRVAWTVWGLTLVTAFVAVPLFGPRDAGLVADLGGMLAALAAAALVLLGMRVRAVIDPDDGEVGIRG